MAFGQHYPDPDIQHGAFRVYPRTDGKWIVVDTRRRPGARTVHVARSKDDAAWVAKAWHEAGHG